jgi:hypothetical protein
MPIRETACSTNPPRPSRADLDQILVAEEITLFYEPQHYGLVFLPKSSIELGPTIPKPKFGIPKSCLFHNSNRPGNLILYELFSIYAA